MKDREAERRELHVAITLKVCKMCPWESWSVYVCEETKAGERPSNELEGIIAGVIFQPE